MLRIISRFEGLVGIHDKSTPLALYKKGEKEAKFITASDIKKVMRHTAAEVYILDPVKDQKILQIVGAFTSRGSLCDPPRDGMHYRKPNTMATALALQRIYGLLTQRRNSVKYASQNT
jgi:hypothetical protein